MGLTRETNGRYEFFFQCMKVARQNKNIDDDGAMPYTAEAASCRRKTTSEKKTTWLLCLYIELSYKYIVL